MKIQPYKTLKSYNESELKERKSVFLAKAYPVNNEDGVNKILDVLKKEYYDASHRCYAYRLLSEKLKFSDAGEPSGTAGIRIFNAIDHYELQDCLVVVIRYFGGTKLGIGPLGKAYYSAAVQVLSESTLITKKPYLQAEIKIAIPTFDKLSRVLAANQIKVMETIFNSEIRLKCLIPLEVFEKIKLKLTEMLKGEVDILINDEIFFK
jgi:uncharacterized YigZ family protein